MNMEKRRVILYGKSVILGTVGASLRNYPDLDAILLPPPLPDVQGLAALAPDVIIFDLQAPHPDFAISLLDACPRLILIGVDPSSDQVFLWFGKHLNVMSTQELVQTIADHLAGTPDRQP
jgi:hypothetical protein